MSFLSAQGSDTFFRNTVVNDLTVNGKLTIVNDEGGTVEIPNNVTLETITSPDETNEINLSVANQLTLKSTNTYLTGNLNIQNHDIYGVTSISGNSTTHVVEIATGNLFQVSGISNGLGDCKTQGAYLDWNDVSGDGKMNLINNRGSGGGGFSFFNVHTDSSGNVGDTSEVVDINSTGDLTLYSTTDVSGTTASLVTNGGALIKKQLIVDGNVTCVGTETISNTADVSGTTASFVTKGGAIISKQLHVNGNVTFVGTETISNTADVSGTTASFVTEGGAIISKQLHVNGNTTLAGIMHCQNTTNATAYNNGAVIIDGGMGIAKDLYIDGNLYMENKNIVGVTSIAGNSSTHIVEIASGSLMQVVGSGAGISECKTQGAYIDWNESNGQGKTNFVNNRGLGGGGFSFYNVSTDSSSTVQNTTEILDIDASGNLTCGTITSKDLTVTGNINCTGIVKSSDTELYQEFHSVIVTGNAGTVTGTITLNSSQNTTNYGVFPSIYDNLPGGSGGTYNANDTSGAFQNVIISSITTTSFSYTVAKSTGNNVNATLLFWVIFSSQLSYNKVSN